MSRLTKMHNGDEVDFPKPRITKITPSHLIPGAIQDVNFIGYNLNEFTWIEIDSSTTNYCDYNDDGSITVNITTDPLSNIQGSENLPGNRDFKVNRGTQEKYHYFSNLLVLTDPSVVPQSDDKGWLDLRSGNDYNIDNNSGSEIRYYRSSSVTQNANGIYNNRNGFIAFPILEWERSQTKKTVDFVFYLDGRRTFSFGLINENFNFNSSSFYQAIATFRIDRDEIENCYGNGLKNQFGSTEIKDDKNYRLRINNNGDRGELVQLFQLVSSAKNDWDDGDLIWQMPVPLNFIESGTLITPVMFEYNRSSNPLRGVRAF